MNLNPAQNGRFQGMEQRFDGDEGRGRDHDPLTRPVNERLNDALDPGFGVVGTARQDSLNEGAAADRLREQVAIVGGASPRGLTRSRRVNHQVNP